MIFFCLKNANIKQWNDKFVKQIVLFRPNYKNDYKNIKILISHYTGVLSPQQLCFKELFMDLIMENYLTNIHDYFEGMWSQNLTIKNQSVKLNNLLKMF